MVVIRNFCYLDSDKLRSLSSQLFEGVTEYVISSDVQDHTVHDEQKGQLGSGQVIADIYKKVASSSQLKFLEDHAYTLFERRLGETARITKISENDETAELEHPFVLVSGRLALNDIGHMAKVAETFNEFGEAMFRVVNASEINAGKLGKPLSDNEVRAKAKASGMMMEPKFLQSLKTTLAFAFQDMLEAQIRVGQRLFSAPLKRSGLREPEHMLIQKFSRLSQANFTMLGVITQRGGGETPASPPDVSDASNLKDAMRTMMGHLHVLESSFSEPLAGEVIVDPVAIYISL